MSLPDFAILTTTGRHSSAARVLRPVTPCPSAGSVVMHFATGFGRTYRSPPTARSTSSHVHGRFGGGPGSDSRKVGISAQVSTLFLTRRTLRGATIHKAPALTALATTATAKAMV